jgi:hypothetical protein
VSGVPGDAEALLVLLSHYVLVTSHASPGPCPSRRLLGLEPSAQAQVFNFYQAVLEATIEAAKKDGKYDDGIVDVSGSSVLLAEEPQTVLTVRPSGIDVAKYRRQCSFMTLCQSNA